MSVIDRLVEAVSPAAGLRRQKQRLALGMLRAYEGGRLTERTSRWISLDSGPNAEIGPAMSRLRARSRQMVRDNPYAARAVSVLAAHQIGYGITARWEDPAAQTLWDQWIQQCDLAGMQSFDALQWQVARSRAESGEVLVRMVRVAPRWAAERGLMVPLQLDVLEGDFLPEDTGGWSDARFANKNVRNGVEFDSTGQRAAYWLRRQHPGEYSSNLTMQEVLDRVLAKEVLHIFRAQRPGQVRGVPDLAPVLMRLRQLDDYEDAALEAAKVQATLAVFLKSIDGLDVGLAPAVAPDPIQLSPGLVAELPPGTEAQFLAPNGAGAFEPYALHTLMSVAAGFGVTYDQLTGDLRQANYSSLRAGKIEFRRMIEQDQWLMFIPRLCEPVASAFIEAAVLSGALPFRPDGYAREWGPPRFEMVDPNKEIGAAIASVRAGFSTWQDQVAGFGYDPRNQVARIAEWNAQIDDAGIILDTDPRRTANSGGAQNAQQNAAVEIAATGAASDAVPDDPAMAALRGALAARLMAGGDDDE